MYRHLTQIAGGFPLAGRGRIYKCIYMYIYVYNIYVYMTLSPYIYEYILHIYVNMYIGISPK